MIFVDPVDNRELVGEVREAVFKRYLPSARGARLSSRTAADGRERDVHPRGTNHTTGKR